MPSCLFNPDDAAFRALRQSPDFIDKTGLLAYANSVFESSDGLLCLARPEGFGKTAALDMLSAFYSRGADAADLVDGLAISQTPSWRDRLNRCHVLRINLAPFLAGGAAPSLPRALTSAVPSELATAFPAVPDLATETLPEALLRIHQATGAVFVILIDDWDAPFWDDRVSDADGDCYLEFLTALFKGTIPAQYLALAVLAGRLPLMPRLGPAPNNFSQFTMLGAGPLAAQAGFTEAEVRTLCRQHGQDAEDVFHQCGGWILNGVPLCCPAAVLSELHGGYEVSEETIQCIADLLRQPIEGLREAVSALIEGAAVEFEPRRFLNDPRHIRHVDEALALWVHQGFLSFRFETQTAVIPNEALRQAFQKAMAALSD